MLPARVEGYRREWLDALCLSGESSGGGSGCAPGGEERQRDRAWRRGAFARDADRAFALREDLPWLLAVARGGVSTLRPGAGPAATCSRALRRAVRSSTRSSRDASGLPGRGRGGALGSGLARPRHRQRLPGRARAARRGERRAAQGSASPRAGAAAAASRARGGRWAPLAAQLAVDPDQRAQAVAEQLLERWGVVFRDLLVRETLAVSWREILWALRRLEARGAIRAAAASSPASSASSTRYPAPSRRCAGPAGWSAPARRYASPRWIPSTWSA